MRNIFIRYFAIIVISSFLVISQSFAEPSKIVGTVVGVHDGDTITVLTSEKKSLKIRLAEIDAPELKQPYGQKAKQSLSGLVFEKKVTVEVQDIDRYGRSVGIVYRGETNVNRTMVSLGMAWAYRQYLKDPALLDIEAKSKSNKSGLWSLPETERIPPWEFRRGGKKIQREENTIIACTMDAKACPDGSHVSRSGPSCEFAPCPRSNDAEPLVIEDTAFTCSGKTACKQMVSCAEAMFYLNHCGLNRLDGNQDGIPCVSICK